MREAVVAVEVDARIGVITTEPLPAPGVVLVLTLHDMVSGLEKGLLDIEDAINVEDRDNIEGHILEQVDIVLVIMDFAVKELEQDVEGHLDGDTLTGMVRTCDKNGRTVFGRLVALLQPDQRNVTAFIALTKARHLN